MLYGKAREAHGTRRNELLLAFSAKDGILELTENETGGICMIGKNIRRSREAKGFTQEELARRLNVTRQAVSNWETEKTQPDIDTLQKLAQHLEVSAEELIYGTRKEYSVTVNNVTKNVTKGVSFGSALAMSLSYVKWQSIGWAVFHGILNWGYVIYYILRYGWS